MGSGFHGAEGLDHQMQGDQRQPQTDTHPSKVAVTPLGAESERKRFSDHLYGEA